jgi:isopenicillin N synthase-like dioxygenase
MADIPIVDFGTFLTGSQEQKEQVAKQIDDAFRDVGFVYLRNHGVSGDMVGECFAWSKKFFALPLETKMLAPHPPGGSHHRGYSAVGVEKVVGKEAEGWDANELNKMREVRCSMSSCRCETIC